MAEGASLRTASKAGSPPLPARLAEATRAALLRELRINSPIARVQLARRTGLRKPAVTRTVAALVRDGLVTETGTGETGQSGGKPPTLLALNPHAAAGLGCMMTFDRVVACLAGFDGEIEYRRELALRPRATPTDAVEAMLSVLAEAAAANPGDRPIAGIGVGVPGMVDETGRVIMTRMPGWAGYPLAAPLADQFGLPVLVDNESRVHALAEGWFGSARGIRDYVTLMTGRGLAAGIVINGRLWRGVRSLAGEIGHTSVWGDGSRCHCGNEGCWETHATSTELLRNAEMTRTAEGNTAQLRDHQPLDIEWITDKLRAHEPFVTREVQAHASTLARGIANIILAYDPELIILHGESARLGQPLVDEIKNYVRRRFARVLEFEPPISLSNLGPDVGLIGAVSLVFRHSWGLQEDPLYGGAPAADGERTHHRIVRTATPR
jgi:predicted NBD/HSP70 family sugar kinase